MSKKLLSFQWNVKKYWVFNFQTLWSQPRGNLCSLLTLAGEAGPMRRLVGDVHLHLHLHQKVDEEVWAKNFYYIGVLRLQPSHGCHPLGTPGGLDLVWFELITRTHWGPQVEAEMAKVTSPEVGNWENYFQQFLAFCLLLDIGRCSYLSFPGWDQLVQSVHGIQGCVHAPVSS